MDQEQLSLIIAGIIGPVLIVLSIAEYKNFSIWEKAIPSITFLNGLVLSILGVTLLRIHFVLGGWESIVTLVGLALAILGFSRMLFPMATTTHKKSIYISLVFLLMFIVGVYLSVMAYILN